MDSTTLLSFLKQNSSNFDPALHAYFLNCNNNDQLVVINIKADWCAPCKYMEPKLTQFASDYKNNGLLISDVDVDKLNVMVGNIAVKSIPTFLLIKKGEIVDKVVGPWEIELKKAIEKHI